MLPSSNIAYNYPTFLLREHNKFYIHIYIEKLLFTSILHEMLNFNYLDQLSGSSYITSW